MNQIREQVVHQLNLITIVTQSVPEKKKENHLQNPLKKRQRTSLTRNRKLKGRGGGRRGGGRDRRGRGAGGARGRGIGRGRRGRAGGKRKRGRYWSTVWSSFFFLFFCLFVVLNFGLWTPDFGFFWNWYVLWLVVGILWFNNSLVCGNTCS